MSRFLRKTLESLSPYTPGEQPKADKLIKLNTNESPYPPSPNVVQAIKDQADTQRLYPDPTVADGTKAVADYYGLQIDQVILGNGSDEILAFAYMAYGEKVAFPQISYGFYPVFADLFQSKSKAIPLGPNLEINPADYYGAEATVIIANPNAPTGMALDLDQIEAILVSNQDQVVIIDEAYVDFGAQSAVKLINDHPNLLVVQTMSKSRSLAGMRIGMAMGNKELIDDLNRVKYSFNPYSLSRDAIVAAKASMEDEEYFRKTTEAIMTTREDFVEKIKALGFKVLPSLANFVFVSGGKEYYQGLRDRGIIVRYFDKDPIRDYVRITIGTPLEMETLLKVTEELI